MRYLLKALSYLPLPVLYSLSSVLRFLAFDLCGYRRTIIDKNLQIMFPDKELRERTHIARKFKRCFTDSLFEAIKAYKLSEAELIRRVTIKNPELLQPFLAQDREILILTLHQSSLEWLIQRIFQSLPCPVIAAYKPLHNTTMDTFIKEVRSRYGEMIPMRGMLKNLFARPRDRRGILLIADQSPISKRKRYWAPFFGKPAPFFFGPQVIAEELQIPVVFAHPRRLQRGFYSIEWELLAEPPYEIGQNLVLERFVAACERSIHEQPESWWLSNRKWKSPKPWELPLHEAD